jgi:hypothetical protein
MESDNARFSFLIDSDISNNSSVVSLMAEQTITTWFFFETVWINFATDLICFGVASDVPPNFTTSLIGILS